MDLDLKFKGGGSFVTLPPVFSSNSENVFVAWKNSILCYNSKTGKRISQFTGLNGTVVGFGVHKFSAYECITACSKKGELITWKISTQFKILNIKIGKRNILSFNMVPSDGACGSAEAIISFKEEGTLFFANCDLQAEALRHYSFRIEPQEFKIDVSREYFAVCYGSKYSVLVVNDFTKFTTRLIEKSRRFTCLACHPEEEAILTGDDTGRVILWQKLFAPKPTQAVFHWHTLPVKSVSFSTSGTYFYTGGDECVLVKWQANNHLERKFLPRLPSGIAQITVSQDNVYIALATSDNAVRIVDSKFANVSLIQHLVIGDQFESGIVMDPRTRGLVMNGNIGQIQFYSPNDGNLLYNVDVVGQNKITNERNCKIECTRITKVAISKSGLWMATVEERKDAEYANEVRLKFWLFDLEIQNFKLNTSIEYPHEISVKSISFQPITNESELKCVTTGADKKFRIWQLTDASTIYKKEIAWKCLYTGFYRDLPCNSSAFSIDGSLAAISFDQIVTTWAPDSCELKCSLVHQRYKEKINHLYFGNRNQCHLIVAAGQNRLFVWNLLTLSLIWTVPLKVSLLIADSITTNMAVVTANHRIFVFSPNSPVPVYQTKDIFEDTNSVCAASFVPSKHSNDVRLEWHQRSPLFLIDGNKELFSLGADESITDTTGHINEENQSLFSMILPHLQTGQVQQQKPMFHTFIKDTSQKGIKKYFDAPLHTMIPVRFICASLLKSVVQQKSATE